MGLVLDNREQANDGLWATHAELPSLPGESLVSVLPPRRPASVMQHPAEGGGLCQLRRVTQPANIQREEEPSPHHFLFYLFICTQALVPVCLATCSDSGSE